MCIVGYKFAKEPVFKMLLFIYGFTVPGKLTAESFFMYFFIYLTLKLWVSPKLNKMQDVIRVS